MRITIIGLGLIGGSAALAWKQAHAEGRFPGGSLSITAVDTNPATLSLALERGIADRVTPSIVEGVLDADLVLLAVPVLAMGAVMKEVDRAAPVDAVITDAGSVRGSVITAVRLNARPERIRHYVPLHPIAGAEKAGLEFATPTLYRGATGVVTPLPESDLEDAAVVVDLWRAAGLTVVEMTPEEHDRIYAMVSHVPHMIAFALMDMAVSSPESRTALAAAGGGFRDPHRGRRRAHVGRHHESEPHGHLRRHQPLRGRPHASQGARGRRRLRGLQDLFRTHGCGAQGDQLEPAARSGGQVGRGRREGLRPCTIIQSSSRLYAYNSCTAHHACVLTGQEQRQSERREEMSNRLPRALLADIAAVIGSGDHASALMMLGDESGPEASAAVSSYRAQCAAALGDFDAAERHLRVALDLVERRMTALPADEAARERLAAALTILPPADAPVTPTLEVISPELTAVRLRRMLAAVFMKAGRELDAEMELALLPVEARSL